MELSNIPIFNYNDMNINYVKKGKREPLVLLQGWATTIQGWTFVQPYFKNKMIDNRGIRESSKFIEQHLN